MGFTLIVGVFYHLFGHCDWECQLGHCWWVFAAEALYVALDWEVVRVWGSVKGAFVSIQFEGFADGRKGVSDSLNFDLASFTIVASPHPSSVRCDCKVCDEGI